MFIHAIVIEKNNHATYGFVWIQVNQLVGEVEENWKWKQLCLDTGQPACGRGRR